MFFQRQRFVKTLYITLSTLRRRESSHSKPFWTVALKTSISDCSQACVLFAVDIKIPIRKSSSNSIKMQYRYFGKRENGKTRKRASNKTYWKIPEWTLSAQRASALGVYSKQRLETSKHGSPSRLVSVEVCLVILLFWMLLIFPLQLLYSFDYALRASNWIQTHQL